MSGASFASLRGQLLVAAPVLLDPTFRRSVILMIEHEPHGAVGLVLNRPSDVDARESAPDLARVLEDGDPAHLGGPVQTDAVIALAEYRDPGTAPAPLVVGPVGLVTDDVATESIDELVARARVYIGYAGWGPGQLEGELAQEAWFTELAQPADVFGDEALWSQVLTRMGGSYRLVATMPLDPSLN